jgi:hypothetical protein
LKRFNVVLCAFILAAAFTASVEGVAVGPAPGERSFSISAVQQRRANDEAHAFVLDDIINVSDADSEPGDGSQLTGGVIPTAQELAEMAKTARVTEAVRLNKVGFARINAMRAERGLPLLVAGRDVQVAPIGMDLETAVPPLDSTASSRGLNATGASTAEVPSGGSEAVGVLAIPAAVDNSTLECFPPIRNQKYGSCGQFSGVYYALTHETALLRGWNAKTGGDVYRFSPYFTYNLLNNGSGGAGSSTTKGWDIVAKHGAPRWNEFAGNTATEWCTDPAVIRRMLEDRTESWGTIYNVDQPAGLNQLKEFLNNGHVGNYSTWISSWQYKTAGDDPSTSDDDAFAGKKVAYTIDGREGSHAMTVVGYDDTIWCDIDGDGVVDSNEKGALRIANSWGTGWEEGGFCWVSYDALRNDIFFADKVEYVIPPAAPHIPRVVAKLTVNHFQRNETAITQVGVGDSGSSAPSVSHLTGMHTEVYDGAGWSQGGEFSYSGAAPAAEDYTYYLDLTDYFPAEGESKRWFLEMAEFVAGGSELSLKQFDLYSAHPTGDLLVASHTNLPVTVDDGRQWVGIDWVYDAPNYFAPQAPDQSLSTLENTDLTVFLDATDADRNALTYTVLTQPTNGTVNGTAPDLTYAPDQDYFGGDSLTWKVSDRTFGSTTATVSIVVTPHIPEVSVVATDAAAAEEGEDTGIWTLTRTGIGDNIRFPLAVAFNLGGTATETNDFTCDAGTPVTIAADQNSVTVTLTPVDDSTRSENSETAILTIVPDAAYTTGVASATIAIADNDSEAPVVDAGTNQTVTLIKSPVPSPPSEWSYAAWTGDEDSGIGSYYTYTATHTFGFGRRSGGSVTVNGVTFVEDYSDSGSGWRIDGAYSTYTDTGGNVMGGSRDLAKGCIYFDAPITTTFTNLQVGQRYRTTFFSVAWSDDVAERTFTLSGEDPFVVDQQLYQTDNGIKIECGYTATGTTQTVTIEPNAGYLPLFAILNREDNVATVALDGTVTDGDGDVPATTWTQVSGPGPVGFADPAAIDTTATFPAGGTYVLRLFADDGFLQGSNDVSVTVADPSLYASGGRITPCAWVEAFGGDPALGNEDSDGLTLDQEFLINTDPTEANEFEIIAFGMTPGTQPWLQYRANGMPNGTLSVLSCTNLAAGIWGELAGSLSTPSSNVVQWTGSSVVQTNALLRVQVSE